jgi:hypothetical protein
MRKKKSEAKRQQEMEQLLAAVAENERELRTGRTKGGRGKGEKTGRKAGVRRGGLNETEMKDAFNPCKPWVNRHWGLCGAHTIAASFRGKGVSPPT